MTSAKSSIFTRPRGSPASIGEVSKKAGRPWQSPPDVNQGGKLKRCDGQGLMKQMGKTELGSSRSERQSKGEKAHYRADDDTVRDGESEY